MDCGEQYKATQLRLASQRTTGQVGTVNERKTSSKASSDLVGVAKSYEAQKRE